MKLLAISRAGGYNSHTKGTVQKTVFAALLALALLFAACGTPSAAPAESAQPVEAGEDGQNAVMNFIGVYSGAGSTEALVEAEGMDSARITVTRAESPWFHTQTLMRGAFDPETRTVSFGGSTLTEYTYASDGSVANETSSSVPGKGRAVFDEGGALTIINEYDTGSITEVYTWGASPDMRFVSDPGHYAAVTAMDKAEIETVAAFNLRGLYLSENWFAMSEYVRYPITINGAELDDADAFIGYMTDKTVSESDREAMLNETLFDMFVNDQGIMLGSGQLWLSDPNLGTGEAPRLEIIAINGIVEK